MSLRKSGWLPCRESQPQLSALHDCLGEDRWEEASRSPRSFDQPVWDGSSAAWQRLQATGVGGAAGSTGGKAHYTGSYAVQPLGGARHSDGVGAAPASASNSPGPTVLGMSIPGTDWIQVGKLVKGWAHRSAVTRATNSAAATNKMPNSIASAPYNGMPALCIQRVKTEIPTAPAIMASQMAMNAKPAPQFIYRLPTKWKASQASVRL